MPAIDGATSETATRKAKDSQILILASRGRPVRSSALSVAGSGKEAHETTMSPWDSTNPMPPRRSLFEASTCRITVAAAACDCQRARLLPSSS